MTKKLYLNTESTSISHIYNINQILLVNHNMIIVKPFNFVPYIYFNVIVSDTGSVRIYSNIDVPIDTRSKPFTVSNGGYPWILGNYQKNASYESKLSKNIVIDNKSII